MPKERSHTGESLMKGVVRFFKSISRTVPARARDTGEELVNDLGTPIMLTDYIIPPTEGRLCRELGINISTWWRYKDASQYPEMQPAVQYASDRIAEYLQQELLTREGKDVRGVIFNLQNNYGWSEKKEIEVGAETRKTVQDIRSMTIEDKLRAIREAQMEASK